MILYPICVFGFRVRDVVSIWLVFKLKFSLWRSQSIKSRVLIQDRVKSGPSEYDLTSINLKTLLSIPKLEVETSLNRIVFYNSPLVVDSFNVWNCNSKIRLR